MKKSRLLLRWALFLLIPWLTACGVRPYDFISPPWNTLSASLRGTPTPVETVKMVASFTPLPTASVTPGAAPSPTGTFLPFTPTATALDTPPAGLAQLLLENRTAYTVYIRLEGKEERYYELAAAETLAVELPAGVYDYWIVIPEEQSLNGQKVIYSGFSNWVLYDTPGVVESPTPWRPGWGS